MQLQFLKTKIIENGELNSDIIINISQIKKIMPECGAKYSVIYFVDDEEIIINVPFKSFKKLIL